MDDNNIIPITSKQAKEVAKNNVSTYTARKKQDVLKKGYNAFDELKSDISGFVLVAFNSQGEHSVVYAGELGITEVLGTLELLKSALINDVTPFPTTLDAEDLFEEDVD